MLKNIILVLAIFFPSICLAKYASITTNNGSIVIFFDGYQPILSFFDHESLEYEEFCDLLDLTSYISVRSELLDAFEFNKKVKTIYLKEGEFGFDYLLSLKRTILWHPFLSLDSCDSKSHPLNLAN